MSKYKRRRMTAVIVAAAMITAPVYFTRTCKPPAPTPFPIVTPQPAPQIVPQAVIVSPVITPTPAPTPVPTEEPIEVPLVEELPVVEEEPMASPLPRYALSDSERDLVERVVMAEAGGEPYEGQMLVAQCILNAAEKSGTAPSKAVVEYGYTTRRKKPTDSVKSAVTAVFDRGERVVDEPILYFYNPAKVVSRWHEKQIFVIEVGGHRFFAERNSEE